jgi:hypothetical protein
LLDQLLLTDDPDFNPETAAKGEAIDIPQAVHPGAKLAVTWGYIKFSSEKRATSEEKERRTTK